MAIGSSTIAGASIASSGGSMVRVTHDVGVAYYSRLVCNTEIAYALRARTTQETEVAYGLLGYDRVNAEISIMAPLRVGIETEMAYSLRERVSAEVEVAYGSTNRITHEAELGYNLNTYNRVSAETTFIYSMLDTAAVTLSGSLQLLHEGRTYFLGGVEISTAEGEYGYSCTAYLRNRGDLAKFQQDEEFIIDLFGEQYTFIVDGRTLDRSAPAEQQAVLTGVSPIMALAAPRADLYSNTFDTATMAKDAVEAILGMTISEWNILDWRIPEYRMSFDSVDPLGAAQEIVGAVMGLIESDYEGNPEIRYTWPISTKNYGTATPDHAFNEHEHIISVQETDDPGRVYTRLRITDIEASYQDVIEWVPDETDGFTGVLRGFPGPWRSEENVNIRTTKELGVNVWPGNPVVRTLLVDGDDGDGELVEVIGGEATVDYPIWSIDTVTWLSVSLGGIVYEQGSNTIRTSNGDGYGLLLLKYNTKYHHYGTNSTVAEPTQYLMEDTTET